jgi:hypothetical protein
MDPADRAGCSTSKSFLSSFKQQSAIVNNDVQVEFLGENAGAMDQIFKESFSGASKVERATGKKQSLPIAVLTYRAGSLNSRKAMISPYLPK